MKSEQKKYKKIMPVVLSAIGIFAVFLIGFWAGRVSGFPQNKASSFDLLDPGRRLYKKEDRIVNFQPLRDELESWRGKPVGIYFEFLNTGANISVNKNLELWPASLMKIPVALAVVKKIERGELTFATEIALLKQDQDDRFGKLYDARPGTRFTIAELLELMLADSDNTAKNILIRQISLKEAQDVLDQLGIEELTSEEYRVRPKKFSTIWRTLYLAAYLNPENSEMLIELMTRSPHKQYLQSGLPPEVVFSHKIGASNDIHADSGIVYLPGRPYILSAMLQEADQSQAEEIMRNISSKIYEYVKNAK